MRWRPLVLMTGSATPAPAASSAVVSRSALFSREPGRALARHR
jgi:hypothetical protein